MHSNMKPIDDQDGSSNLEFNPVDTTPMHPMLDTMKYEGMKEIQDFKNDLSFYCFTFYNRNIDLYSMIMW